MWVELIRQQAARLVEQAEASAQLASLGSFRKRGSAVAPLPFSPGVGGTIAGAGAGANPGTSQELAEMFTEIAHAGAATRAKFPPRLTAALGLLKAHAAFTRRLKYVCEIFVAPLEDMSKGDPTTTASTTAAASSSSTASSSTDSLDRSNTSMMGTTTMLGAAGDFMRRTVKVDLQALLLKPDMLVFLQVKRQRACVCFILL